MSGNWSDLRPRVLSAIVMLAVAIGSAWAGPLVFGLLVCVATGVMIWELACMNQPRFSMAPEIMAATATALVFTTYPMLLGILWVYPIVISLVFAVILAAMVKLDPLYLAAYAFAIMLTGNLLAGLFMVSPDTLILLLSVVVVTDVAGYFAGKSIGGKKFWPRISPKKTWSGVIAGWIGAGLVGAVFVWLGRFDAVIIPVAMAMSFASQLGDIAESSFKRRAGVKDSSNLIPGHGGFLDRFDGVVGASLVLLVFILLR